MAVGYRRSVRIKILEDFMLIHRLQLLAVAVSCMTYGFAFAAAPDYPSRPVRFMVGFAAGGTTEVLARLVSVKLAEKWKQAVIIDIRPGADGSIATGLVSRSAPDGLTIGWVTSAHSITPVTTKLNYDPVNGIAPIILATSNPSLLVTHPGFPAKTVKELIAYAKANPDKVTYASAGTNTIQNLQMLQFMRMANVRTLHVPYKGGGDALTALLKGEVDLYFAGVSTAASQVSAGKLRALGVGSRNRTSFDPNMPTIAEAGDLPGFDASNWTGALAASGTPAEIINKVNADTIEILRTTDMQKRLADLGFVIIASTPKEFGDTIKGDIARWSSLLKDTPVQ